MTVFDDVDEEEDVDDDDDDVDEVWILVVPREQIDTIIPSAKEAIRQQLP